MNPFRDLRNRAGHDALGDCMKTENLGTSLTSEGRIHSIGRTTFQRVD